MFGRSMHLGSFALVLSLVLNRAVHASDPSLVGWWPFNEGSGTVTKDNSSNGHHGSLEGSPKWTSPGWNHRGWCLQFGGDDDRVTVEPFDLTGSGITLAAWVNVIAFQDDARLISKSEGSGTADHYWAMILSGSGENNLEFRLRTDTGATSRYSAPDAEDLQTNEWTHIAVTWDASDPFMRFYKNGQEIFSQSKAGSAVGTGPSVRIALGNQSASVADAAGRIRPFGGLLDDVVVYDRGLTADEILKLMEGLSDPALASSPSPADGATDVARYVVLSWTPGEFAPAVNGHRVYLSEIFSDVNDGIGGVTLSAASYAPSQRLDFETTYYWRVDEVNAPPDSTVFPGEVWSFTTEPVGYPIDGASIIATASSAGQADFGPEKTIDGSGLDENGLHSTEPMDMWISGDEPSGTWIQYEFDRMQKLHQMWVWNSNQIFEGLFGFGMKDVTVEYSTNGTEWTALAGVPQFAKAPGTDNYAHDTTVEFGGAVAQFVRLTATSNWGGILPQFGLSEVRFYSIPVSARAPYPDSGATDVDPDVTLSWRAGREAATHDVYLSTDEQAVIDGTTPAVSVTETSYSTTLDLGNTYYWRIDEVNETETPSTWQGDIWDFTTQPFIGVEGFEDYNDYPPYEIYSTWLDGYENPANGSQVGYLTPPIAETTIIHGGVQSMPLLYSNTAGATYSEATRTFATPQDWTQYGIATLQLWFYGTAGNTGQLYAKINGVKVPYSGDATNLAVESWQPWDIDLTTVGVNLATVTSLAIGIDGNAAAGTLYVDDIRLYAYSEQSITPTDPVTAGLVAYWKFDDGAGNTATDSVGNAHPGTIGGTANWVTGQVGGALDFDGLTNYVDIGGDQPVISGTFSLTMWIYARDIPTVAGDYRMPLSNDTWADRAIHVHIWPETAVFRIDTKNGTDISSNTVIQADQWYHVAGTLDAAGESKIYINGVLDNSATGNGREYIIGPANIGAYQESSRFFNGMIDDVRIYNRILSETEIQKLLGQ